MVTGNTNTVVQIETTMNALIKINCYQIMKQTSSKKYGYTKSTSLAFTDAIVKMREELGKEGFGVLTEIDVSATLKKKLDIDYGNYLILGACNPQFAYEALKAEKEIGLFLPCNTIVYEEEGKTFVSAILPTVAMSVIDNPALAEIAKKVEEKLKRVIDNV